MQKTLGSDNISPIMASRHWLPVKYRIDFPMLLSVFKGTTWSISTIYQQYDSDLGRALRSTDKLLLPIPHSWGTQGCPCILNRCP